MTTVTGMTAARMLEIEAGSVVDGDVVGDHLILTKHDGSTVDAGSVRGPQGIPGPPSSDLSVISATLIGDVGVPSQIRAGRQLAVADFTNMGISAPIALWNLSNLNDASGNGRALLNKGSVQFDAGINGLATTAARFYGATSQALYIADTGAADPFRIRTGSLGCWTRTAKRSTYQGLVNKESSVDGNRCYTLLINNSSTAGVAVSPTGLQAGYVSLIGNIDVCDDRWHFVVATFDGAQARLYVDGVLDVVGYVGPAFAGSGVVNIGAQFADGATNASNPHFGRIDEAFIISDVLTEEQVRNLYCAKIAHTLAAVPTRVTLRVRRKRKGAALVSADFTTAPLRLHNFSAGSLADEGTNNVTLTNNNAAVAVAGADGSAGNAFNFVSGSTQSLSSTDANLPAGTATRSFGCWFKSTDVSTARGILNWGTLGTAEMRLGLATGSIYSYDGATSLSGPFTSDGQWHFAVAVYDNSALDGLKGKLYIDGRLVATSTTFVATTLAGANKFRVGSYNDASSPFSGQVDSVFVVNYAMTLYDIQWLYLKGIQTLAPSPKNAGDHIEAVSSTDILAVFDTLEGQHQIDIGVAA